MPRTLYFIALLLLLAAPHTADARTKRRSAPAKRKAQQCVFEAAPVGVLEETVLYYKEGGRLHFVGWYRETGPTHEILFRFDVNCTSGIGNRQSRMTEYVHRNCAGDVEEGWSKHANTWLFPAPRSRLAGAWDAMCLRKGDYYRCLRDCMTDTECDSCAEQ